MTLLEARGLAVGRGGRTIARGFDLALGAGEVLCVLGPNGGGKTTLLETLLGLLPPHAGEVSIDGVSVKGWTHARLARVLAYVPQAHAVHFSFTALELVLTGRTPRIGTFAVPGARDRGAAHAALAVLGIEALHARAYDALSGGERQLVRIARALAQEPRVLVMDEPTASLDLANQGRVLGVVRRLAAAGLAVVLSSHDPSHAFACADQVALLAGGRLRALGTPHEVVTPAQLRATYGIDVAVVPVPGSVLRACVPGVPSLGEP